MICQEECAPATSLVQNETCVTTCDLVTPLNQSFFCVEQCDEETPYDQMGVCVSQCTEPTPDYQGLLCVLQSSELNEAELQAAVTVPIVVVVSGLIIAFFVYVVMRAKKGVKVIQKQTLQVDQAVVDMIIEQREGDVVEKKE